MSAQSELHNRIVGDIIRSIVKPPLDAGGGFVDCLVLLESVILGVLHLAVKLRSDEKIVLDAVVENVKRRLTEQWMLDLAEKGRRELLDEAEHNP